MYPDNYSLTGKTNAMYASSTGKSSFTASCCQAGKLGLIMFNGYLGRQTDIT